MSQAKRRELIEITIGTVLLSLGFYFFLLPQALVIGGVMGVAVFLKDIIPVSLFVFIANGVLLVIGFLVLGKTFFLKTFYASLLSPTVLFVLEKTIRQDAITRHLEESPLLISTLFGGLLVGVGLGLVLRNNGTTGGIDVIQNIAHKFLHIPFSTAMYVSDGTIILIAMFIDVELGLYALFAMILSGFVIDRIAIEGRSGYTAFVVTDHAALIKDEIYARLDRGVTDVKVRGGYSKSEKDMLICTVDRRQLYVFKRLIRMTDPKAFTFVSRTKEVLGQGFTRGSYQ
ncbi:MAG: YitT family protein [Acholeplasmataceae bacterium]|nr:YitT family protein [Acholeplasmataceae bacterium]